MGSIMLDSESIYEYNSMRTTAFKSSTIGNMILYKVVKAMRLLARLRDYMGWDRPLHIPHIRALDLRRQA